MSEPARNDAAVPTPVVIVTGFLGSGKTTLVSHIMESREHGKRICIVNNELATPIGVDNEIGAAAANAASIVEFHETENGCACCGGGAQSFLDVMRAVAVRRKNFDVVLVETDGLVDPTFAKVFFNDATLSASLRIDGVVTLIDGKNSQRYLMPTTEQARNEAYEQMLFADRVVINKCDLLSEREIQELSARFADINPNAEILHCSYGKIPVAKMFDMNAFSLDRVLERDPKFLEPFRAEKIHDTTITPLVLIVRENVDWNKFRVWLNQTLNNNDIIRSKGCVAVRRRVPRVIFQGVFNTCAFRDGAPWRRHSRYTKIVLIGRKLDKKQLVSSFFDVCGVRAIDEAMLPFEPPPPEPLWSMLFAFAFMLALLLTLSAWLLQEEWSWIAARIPSLAPHIATLIALRAFAFMGLLAVLALRCYMPGLLKSELD